MTASFEIVDLRAVPSFAEIVADRIWQAWWKGKGFSFGHVLNLVQENLRTEESGLPRCFVACDGNTFCGTASCVANDMEERPALSPWLAALWVDPAYRRAGVARRLMQRVTDEAFESGFQELFLCAVSELADFYENDGWRLIENGVGGKELSVFVKGAERVQATL